MRDRDHQDGVAIRRRMGRKLGADDAAGAGAIINDHLLAEPIAHLLRDGAADDVVAAAGRERDDQPDRAIGIILLRRGGGRERNQQSGSGRAVVRAICASLFLPKPISKQFVQTGAQSVFIQP